MVPAVGAGLEGVLGGVLVHLVVDGEVDLARGPSMVPCLCQGPVLRSSPHMESRQDIYFNREQRTAWAADLLRNSKETTARATSSVFLMPEYD